MLPKLRKAQVSTNDSTSLVPYIEFGEDPFNDEEIVAMELMAPDSPMLGLATTVGSELPAQLGDPGSGSPWDHEQRPQYWQVRSEYTAKLQSIACRDGISQSVAWSHTGLVKREGRKPNGWNYWLSKEIERVRAENNGELPGEFRCHRVDQFPLILL